MAEPEVSDAHVINEKAVTEIRFRYGRDDEANYPRQLAPGINVLGAFTGGGSTTGETAPPSNTISSRTTRPYHYSSHFLKFGVRVRDRR